MLNHFRTTATTFCALAMLLINSAASADFDVTAYGASGNGVTNDCASIQTAINAAENAGGGIVLFPRAGTYLLGTSNCLKVTSRGVLLRGAAGWSWKFWETGVVLKYTPTSGTALTVGASNEAFENGLSGFALENITFSGPGRNTSTNGVWFTRNVTGPLIQHASVRHFGTGVRWGAAGSQFFDDGRIRNVWFQNNDVSYRHEGEACCVEISNSQFHGPSSYHIHAVSAPGEIRANNNGFFDSAVNHVYANSGFNFQFSRNTFEDSNPNQGDYMRFEGGARNIRIQGNWFGNGTHDQTIARAIVLVGTREVVVTGNHFQDMFGPYISMWGNGHHLTIVGNSFARGGIASGNRAIWIDASTSGFAVWTTISGNVFSGFGTDVRCFDAGGYPRKILVVGNAGACTLPSPLPPGISVPTGTNVFQ